MVLGVKLKILYNEVNKVRLCYPTNRDVEIYYNSRVEKINPKNLLKLFWNNFASILGLP